MDQLTFVGGVLAVVGAAVGATWTLRTALARIESALRAHVADDRQQFRALGARVVKLEERTGRARVRR